jgi:ABC-type Na+ efflux pump permease subunit
MSMTTEAQRPKSVVFASAMMYFGAFMYAVGVVINLTMLFRPEQVQLLFGSPVNDWYWVVNASLDFILVIGFAWVARMAYRGDYGAGMTISLLAVLNIVFSMFRLGHVYGWITLAISIAVLAANLSSSAQDWYRAHLPARPAA